MLQTTELRVASRSLLHTKYYSGDQLKEGEMGETCGKYLRKEKWVRGFCWKTWRKDPLGRPRHRWLDNIKISTTWIVSHGAGWIYLTRSRGQWWVCVNTLINLRAPQNMGTSSTSFSGTTLLHGTDYLYEQYSLVVQGDSWATVAGLSFAQCAAPRGSLAVLSHLWCHSPRGVVGGWLNSVRSGSVGSKESGARLREWGCGVGSWQGQGRSSHFTKARISVQLLAVEGVCTTCVELCTGSQVMTTVTITRKQWKVIQLIFFLYKV